jgi:hypothetical protein
MTLIKTRWGQRWPAFVPAACPNYFFSIYSISSSGGVKGQLGQIKLTNVPTKTLLNINKHFIYIYVCLSRCALWFIYRVPPLAKNFATWCQCYHCDSRPGSDKWKKQKICISTIQTQDLNIHVVSSVHTELRDTCDYIAKLFFNYTVFNLIFYIWHPKRHQILKLLTAKL